MMRRAAATAAATVAAAAALLPFLAAPHTAPILPPPLRATQTPAPAPVVALQEAAGARVASRAHTAPARANRYERRPPLIGGPVHYRRAPAVAKRQHVPARRYADLGVWRVTKYCSTGNRTASDTWPAIGDAATLDRGIPFGTLLRIVGRDRADGRWIDQTFTVTDRIGHGSQLDLYAGGEGDPSCEPRVNRTWGRQYLRVLEVLPAR